MESWIEHQVGHDIALELQGIAHKHNVFDFSADQLNAFKELSITIDTPVNGAVVTKLVPAQEIAYALAAVVGVVGWIILPYITGFILGLVGLFFETLVINILVLLIANPMTTLVGFAAIALLLGAGVLVGYKENKEKINDWLQKQDLPVIVRKAIKMDDLANQMRKNRQELVGRITRELNTEETRDKLSRGIYSCTKSQVRDRANQIRYEIETR